ncbi:Tn3 family transposase [Xenorhabdus beddingii]|uniref:Tn3 family transposase n=1 Tax=Xenorhabdus beddingii TaxID=40578 RepID=UPI00111C1078
MNGGLNVVEQWNGATDFVFFVRRGKMASNYREVHEVKLKWRLVTQLLGLPRGICT